MTSQDSDRRRATRPGDRSGGEGGGSRPPRGRGRGGEGRGGGRGDRRGGDRRGGDRRGRDERPSRREHLLEEVRSLLKAVDRPLVKGDFAEQHGPLERLRKTLQTLSPRSLDDLGDDLKARTLTLLLRVGRQTRASEDEDREKARRGALEALARVWLALQDERRAAAALAAAGLEKAASALLKETGDWEARVALHRSTGALEEAARILEANERWTEAAEVWAEAGAPTQRLRALARAGDEAAVMEALSQLSTEEAEPLARRLGVLDQWAQVLTARGDWAALGRLYEAHGQAAIAARAYEEAGDLKRAVRLYREVGDAEGHARALKARVEELVDRNDVMGASRLLATEGHLERAAELASDKHPEQAHQWFVEGGYLDRALELARREARRAEGHDDFSARALWLERAGDLISAATLLEGLDELPRAQALYERARAWEPAARLAERRGRLDEAVELFYRANLSDEAERVKLLA